MNSNSSQDTTDVQRIKCNNEGKANNDIKCREEVWDACEEDLIEAVAHGILVSNLAFMVAKELGTPKEVCYELAKAGIVHDIGKLKLGDYLYKRRNDTLRIEEMKYVRLHPKFGYEFLKERNEYSDELLQWIYHHHENYDGSGYPDNLSGTAIPYGARILRTCDVFCALVAERRYRAAFDIDTAIELMIDEVKNFDMEIFLAFLKVVHSRAFVPIRHYIKDTNSRIKRAAKADSTQPKLA